MLSSTTILLLACSLVGGGILLRMGIVSLLALLVVGGLGVGLMLANAYLPPEVIMAMALVAAVGGFALQKGMSVLGYVIAFILLGGLALVCHLYLSEEILVRLSLTIIFLAGLRLCM